MSIKKIRHLLLSGVIVSVGLWSMPGTAQGNDKQINAMVEALRIAAPPQSQNDGMHSPWQVLPGIIPDWTERCTGTSMTPAQFDADQAAARNTVSCIVKRELNKNMSATGNDAQAAVRRTACWWMTGQENACTSGATATYVNKVVEAYQKQMSGS